MAERDRGRDYVPCRMLHPKPHSHCSIYLGKKQYILMTKIRAAQTVGQYHPYRLRLRRKESCWTRFCVFCVRLRARKTHKNVSNNLWLPAATRLYLFPGEDSPPKIGNTQKRVQQFVIACGDPPVPIPRRGFPPKNRKHTKTCPTICGCLRRPACTYSPERSLSSVIGRSRTRVPVA